MENYSEIIKRIELVEERLIQRSVATKETICGCSSDEIDRIEEDAGAILPASYREFLSRMGRSAGNFYVGTDIFFPRILGLKTAAKELVAEEKGLVLPEDAIVIIMHQGYQFIFIRGNEGDDPPVYYYLEQAGGFEKKNDRLSKFLLDVASDPW